MQGEVGRKMVEVVQSQFGEVQILANKGFLDELMPWCKWCCWKRHEAELAGWLGGKMTCGMGIYSPEAFCSTTEVKGEGLDEGKAAESNCPVDAARHKRPLLNLC